MTAVASRLRGAMGHPTALATAAGVLFAFAAEPAGLTPLLALASLLWLHAMQLGPDGVRGAARVGFVVGASCHVLAFHWAYELITGHVPIPWFVGVIGSALLFASQALPFTVASALTAIGRRAGLPLGVAFALGAPLGFEVSWTLFPWRPAEIATGFVELAQLADLVGPTGLDLVVLGLPGLVYDGMVRRDVRRYAVAAAALAGCLGYGFVRIEQVERARASARPVVLGAVQPNVQQRLKFDAGLAPSQLDALRRLSAEVEALSVDLVVWPETAYPMPLPLGLRRDPAGRRSVLGEGAVRGPVVFGALTVGDGCDHRNSVFALDASGRIVGRADKVELLPFSEYVPLHAQLTFLHRALPCPGFAPGDGPGVLEVGGARLGMLNCYEDLLPWYAREVALREPDVLLNVTNDAWFWDSAEPHLHHMAASLRAIETRRDLVRVVNTGLTGVIEATGRRGGELPVWQPGVLRAELRALPGLVSPYVRYGDVISRLLALALLAAVARAGLAARAIGAGRAA